MRVLCIDGGIINCVNNPNRKGELLVEGNIYNAIEEDLFEGVVFYVLAEFGYSVAFDSILFIPLSDVDETELIKEREIVNA